MFKMNSVLGVTYLLAAVLSSNTVKKKTIFKKEKLIFSSKFNITQVMVPVENPHYIQTDNKAMPSIFFTISDPNLEGGSCIYVLEGFAAYEVLEGGRDTTTDYGKDPTVYFGSYNGIYKYISDSLGVKKFGPFRDDIIQLQKAKDVDLIYFLNIDHKIYKVENKGTIRSRIEGIVCALEFVLDTSNNIYYLTCEDSMIRILRSDGSALGVVSSLLNLDFDHIKLIRPAFIMEESIPFFADKSLYFLYANGTSEKKDFDLEEMPSAFSVDSALYIIAAKDGKLYEFNVMEILLGSMFGYASDFPDDIAKILMAFIGTAKNQLGINFDKRPKEIMNL